MAGISDVRRGVVIRQPNGLWVVTSFQFTNPGKGSAFTKAKMRNVSNGKTMEVTYKSAETVDIVSVSHVNMQYLYKSGNSYSFMDQNNYETVDVSADVIGEDANYLKDGLDVVALTYEDAVVAIELPKKVKYTVVTAPPAVKGDSAGGNVTKEIILDNGLKLYAPIFIKEGDEIIVNTETGEYGGRSQE